MSDETPDFVPRLVAASAGRDDVSGLTGRVAFGVGAAAVTLELDQGRVIGLSAGAPQVVLSLTRQQFESWASGQLSLSVAYMQGEVKPDGSTGALLAALEILDDPGVSAAMA